MQTFLPVRPVAAVAAGRVYNTFRRLLFFFSFALMAGGLLLTAPAQAQVEINSAGPLTKIGITPTGNLYAYHQSFAHQLYYSGETTSAAVWAVYDAENGLLHGPASVGAGSNMTDSSVYTPWMAGTQTAQTGSGTLADPYKITATVTAASGLEALITVTYVVGDEFFKTSLKVTDTSGAVRNLRAFLGADLFYDNSDNGTVLYDAATGSVGGVGENTGFTGWFVPVTPAQHHFAGSYNDVWSEIGSHQLTDFVASGYLDYGAALQWNITLPANGTTTIDTTQLFSDGLVLLPTLLPDGVVGTPYTQALSPFGGIAPYTLSHLSGTLPPGITFNPATNTLSGTPTAAGTYNFTIRVVDTSPGTQLTRDFPYTLVITQGAPPPPPGGGTSSASQAIPALGNGTLAVLILALSAVVFGISRKKNWF